MALGNMGKKQKKPRASNEQLQAVGEGAAFHTKENGVVKSNKVVFKRYNFSLTEKVSENIDELCLSAKKINRSDIVKAGILLLQEMNASERRKFLEKLK